MHLSPMLRILASVIFLLSIVAVLLPVAANAAVYKSVAEVCNNSTRGGGQMDADGYTYLACDQSTVAGKNYTQSIQILDQQGVKQSTVWLDFRISDVAPSPNGDTLYVVRIDNRSVYRLTGKRGGPYNLDKNWKLENLPKNGVINAGNIVRGEYVATDGQGSLYVSSGLWMDYADHVDQWNTKREYKKDYYVANTIVKYTPDGKYLDNFGSTADSATDINAWNAGVA